MLFPTCENSGARENSPLETSLFAIAAAHHNLFYELLTIIAYDTANRHTGWYVLNIYECALMMDI